MKKVNEKTTIYLDPRVKKSVQYYALRDDSSLSKIINDRLYEYLEDMADITALKAARADGEEPVLLADVIADLGFDVNDLHCKAQAERKKAA